VPDFNSLSELLGYHKFPFQLRADQIEDVENLYVFDHIALFNEVGTGKTATSTAISLAWDVPHNIICVPPILITQWRRWLESLNDVGPVLAYRGDPAKRASFDLTRYRWIVMTIQIFKRDLAKILRQLGSSEVALTVDEGHCVKNVGTANYKLVRDFSAGRKLQILTGTPVSSPGDAYAYTKLKTPLVYRSQQVFENLHVGKKDFFGNVTEWQNLELMQQNLMLQASRRLSKQVLKLGMPNYIPVHYELDPEHLDLYNQLVNEQLLLLPDGGKIDATSAGRLYNASQQIICNWDHFSGDPSKKPRGFELVDEILDEIGADDPRNSKLIVYTWYVMTTRGLLANIDKRYGPVGLYSEVSQSKQDANIDRFLNDPSCRVMVAQPMAGGVGWNPQKVCWEVLFLEEPTFPTPFVQGVGRVDRDGQEHVPNIRLAIAEQTIQYRLHQNLLNNDALANKVQGGYMDLRDAIHGR
jgi:SNF2 family DNA or RNA helicase